jgi:hypothetical protein
VRITIRGKLVAVYEELYTNYVFKNLDEPDNSLMRYVTLTQCPNWLGQKPNIGDIGFIEYEYVEAGDTYFCRETGNESKYKYTTCYFISFIKDREKVSNKEFKF